MDHKQKTQQLLDASGADDRNAPSQSLQAAQVHATLYLAEQQRTANLIALWREYVPMDKILSVLEDLAANT